MMDKEARMKDQMRWIQKHKRERTEFYDKKSEAKAECMMCKSGMHDVQKRCRERRNAGTKILGETECLVYKGTGDKREMKE